MRTASAGADVGCRRIRLARASSLIGSFPRATLARRSAPLSARGPKCCVVRRTISHTPRISEQSVRAYTYDSHALSDHRMNSASQSRARSHRVRTPPSRCLITANATRACRRRATSIGPSRRSRARIGLDENTAPPRCHRTHALNRGRHVPARLQPLSAARTDCRSWLPFWPERVFQVYQDTVRDGTLARGLR